jgi:glycosyltransferase involved in cell wall biosynthesis
MTMKNKILTVIIPVFNEDATIAKVIKRVLDVDIDKQIVIVDDGSTDRTPEILKEFAGTPGITVITHDTNKGRGAGIKTALAQAVGHITIFQDADLELDPGQYPKLIQPILDGETEVVFGSRFLGKGFVQGMGIHAYLANVFFAELTDFLFTVQLTDVLTMFQITKTDIFRQLDIQSDRWGSTLEITCKLLKMGYRIVELPVDYIPRKKDTGKKIRSRDFFACLGTLIRYRFFYRRKS